MQTQFLEINKILDLLEKDKFILNHIEFEEEIIKKQMEKLNNFKLFIKTIKQFKKFILWIENDVMKIIETDSTFYDVYVMPHIKSYKNYFNEFHFFLINHYHDPKTKKWMDELIKIIYDEVDLLIFDLEKLNDISENQN